jgi:hypothetical protein
LSDRPPAFVASGQREHLGRGGQGAGGDYAAVAAIAVHQRPAFVFEQNGGERTGRGDVIDRGVHPA